MREENCKGFSKLIDLCFVVVVIEVAFCDFYGEIEDGKLVERSLHFLGGGEPLIEIAEVPLHSESVYGDAIFEKVFDLLEINKGVIAAIDEDSVIIRIENYIRVAELGHIGHFVDDSVAEAAAEKLAVNHFVVEVELIDSAFEVFSNTDCATIHCRAKPVIIEVPQPGHNMLVHLPENAVSPHRYVKVAADFPDFIGDGIIDDAGLFFAFIPFEGVFVDGIVEVFGEGFEKHFSVFAFEGVFIGFGEAICNRGAECKFMAGLLNLNNRARFGFYYDIAHPDFGDTGFYGGRRELCRNIARSRGKGVRVRVGTGFYEFRLHNLRSLFKFE